MNKTLFSADWYRVENLVVKLKSHTRLARHVYRDQVWYILRDALTGEHHRFNESAYALIGLFDGEHTVHEIWELSIQQLGDQAPTQNDVIFLLGQLFNADVLQTNNPVDAREVFDKAGEKARKKWLAKLSSPLAIKLPLLDPDRFLTRNAWIFQAVFSRIGILVWFALVAYALVLTGLHWQELSSNLRDNVLTPTNLVLLTLLFPLVKVLHELGHAFAVKIWGGEVHEIGVMFLVFIPVPYVEATASALFPERYKRVVVGAAGMMVELAIASLALIIWAGADEGLIKTLAYNIVLLAGVSTLFFNANPLLRFDGYYIFSDSIQIPNLYQRSYHHLEYLAKKHIMGDRSVHSPVNAKGEAFWFVSYALLSWLYRVTIVIVIAVFIAQKFFFIGVAIACWSLYQMFIKPAVKLLRYLLAYQPEIQVARSRFLLCAISGAAFLIVALPLPHWTLAEGVVWVPERNTLRAGANCFVETIDVHQRAQVKAGERILSCRDPLLENEIAVKRAYLEEIEVKYLHALKTDKLQLVLIKEQWEIDKAELKRLLEMQEEMAVYAQVNANVYLQHYQTLQGRFIAKGEILGYLVQDDFTIRVVVNQKDVNAVRANTRKVEFRNVSSLSQVHQASLVREVPGGSDILPSSVLGTAGGGNIPVKPDDARGTLSFDWLFQFDIKPLKNSGQTFFNERIYVRFYHDPMPLIRQWFNSLSLFFMEEMNV